MPTDPIPTSLDALLAAFHAAAPDSVARARFAMALAQTRARDDRVLAALVRMLGDDPVAGAACLARYGNARAIPDLVRVFDSDDRVAKADCAICAEEILDVVANAIEVLGGTLSDAQRARFDRISDEAARLWQSGPDPFPPEVPARRARRPRRNAPCPCGSGKKYKKCCALEQDGAGELH